MEKPPLRTLMKRSFLVTIGTLLLAALATSSETAPQRARRFEFRYTGKVDAIPPGASRLEIWLPYPQSDEHQQVKNVHLAAPVPFEVATDPASGNRMAHLAIDKPQGPVEIGLTFVVERAEYVRKDFPPAGGERPAYPRDVARWLEPDRLVPLDARIRKLAAEVTAGRKTDLEKVRAIYDYVVQTMSYDKSGTGWGNGDIYWACDAKRGNCTDFHALFIGLARAVGVPAKFEIGFPLPPERGQGEVAGYHCWAEFYLRGYGWVPVDASEAKKHLDRKEYFFGALDEDRVQLTVGRDLTLAPRQAGAPLNYFVYPYVEVDGKPYPGIAKQFAFRDLGATDTAKGK
jgi:transglutaminase-like putative cysteine protease